MLTGNHIGPEAVPQDRQLAIHRTSIKEFEQTKSFVVGKQTALRLCCGRRFAKNPGKIVTKTAFLFKTTSISHITHPLTFSHFTQGQPHPTGAMIGLESHSIMTFELPSRS